MGTGMAFPWDVISSIKLASGSIVEDLKLGLELSRIGSPAVFCPSAKVTSYFPSVSTGIQSQRERWEKGHITTILSNAPVFFCQSAICGNASLLALTLDLVVPPLSLLSIFLVGMCLVSGVAMFFGVPTTAFTICAVSSAGFAAAVFLSWVKYGRDILPVSAGPLVASYVAGKLPIYRKVFSKSANIRWIRADRTKHE
jgi:cellulose synthase/poly-beta-1,6-N-acetylglucosamine synthase-like glycosyltransferase